MEGVIFGTLGLCAVLWLFPKMGLLDFPERYGIDRNPIPYPAGLSLVVAFFSAVFLFFPFTPDNSTALFGFLGGLFLLAVTSFFDDRHQISPLIRLFVQSIAALLVIFSGTWVEFLTNPFSPEAFHLSFFVGGSITFLWILGFINTTNWLDGVPNLTIASGAVASCSLGILSLSPSVQQHEMATLCFLFTAVLFPFIVGNFGKTRFILGDTGSMSIGFCLAVFSLFAGGKMATVLIVMSIPIFDGIFVFAARILQKKSPLTGGDGLHLHDTLLAKGWNNFHIFLLYFLTAFSLGTSVLFLETWGKLLLISFFGIVFMTTRFIMMREN